VPKQVGQFHGAFRVIRRENLVDDLGGRRGEVLRGHGQWQQDVATDVEVLGYHLEWPSAEVTVVIGPGSCAERRYQRGHQKAGCQSVLDVHITLQQLELVERSR
jgi:hypothetical protein